MKTIIKLKMLFALLLLLQIGYAQTFHPPLSRIYYGLSQGLEPKNLDGIKPFGFGFGFLNEVKPRSSFLIGGEFEYQNFGQHQSAGLTTAHNIYNLNFRALWRMWKGVGFNSYLSGSIGVSGIGTRSYSGPGGMAVGTGNFIAAMMYSLTDTPEEHRKYKSVDVHHSFGTSRPSASVQLGLEFPLKQKFGHFFWEVGYQLLGSTSIVEKQHVQRDDSGLIYYQPVKRNLALVNFKVGVCHYF